MPSPGAHPAPSATEKVTKTHGSPETGSWGEGVSLWMPPQFPVASLGQTRLCPPMYPNKLQAISPPLTVRPVSPHPAWAGDVLSESQEGLWKAKKACDRHLEKPGPTCVTSRHTSSPCSTCLRVENKADYEGLVFSV